MAGGLDEVSQAIGRLEGEVQSLVRSLGAIPGQLEAMEQRLSNAIDEIRQRHHRQVKDLSVAITHDLDEYRRRDEARRDAIAAMHRQADEALDKTASLRGRVDKAEQRLDGLENGERERRAQARLRRRDVALAGSLGGAVIAAVVEGVKLWWMGR
jgi:chromosome segregation ATPase